MLPCSVKYQGCFSTWTWPGSLYVNYSTVGAMETKLKCFFGHTEVEAFTVICVCSHLKCMTHGMLERSCTAPFDGSQTCNHGKLFQAEESNRSTLMEMQNSLFRLCRMKLARPLSWDNLGWISKWDGNTRSARSLQFQGSLSHERSCRQRHICGGNFRVINAKSKPVSLVQHLQMDSYHSEMN